MANSKGQWRLIERSQRLYDWADLDALGKYPLCGGQEPGFYFIWNASMGIGQANRSERLFIGGWWRFLQPGNVC